MRRVCSGSSNLYLFIQEDKENENQTDASLLYGRRPRFDGSTFFHLSVHPGTELELVHHFGTRHDAARAGNSGRAVSS
jgi:hypothetical protein